MLLLRDPHLVRDLGRRGPIVEWRFILRVQLNCLLNKLVPCVFELLTCSKFTSIQPFAFIVVNWLWWRGSTARSTCIVIPYNTYLNTVKLMWTNNCFCTCLPGSEECQARLFVIVEIFLLFELEVSIAAPDLWLDQLERLTQDQPKLTYHRILHPTEISSFLAFQKVELNIKQFNWIRNNNNILIIFKVIIMRRNI